MNRIELYKKTEEVLYQAYFNDTLKHGNCSACAVGNICIGAAIQTGVLPSAWNVIFVTSDYGQLFAETGEITFSIERGLYHIVEGFSASRMKAEKLISATGYTIRELASIERAFESAPKAASAEDYMFNGLVAVLEVLKQIHGIEDTDTDRFKAVYQSRTAVHQ